MAILILCGLAAPASAADEVPFTATSTGTYTITGGAGAFANATGSGTITTEIDRCAGTATGTYTGAISRPNSN